MILFWGVVVLCTDGGDADCSAGLVRVVRYSCSCFCFCDNGFEVKRGDIVPRVKYQ